MTVLWIILYCNTFVCICWIFELFFSINIFYWPQYSHSVLIFLKILFNICDTSRHDKAFSWLQESTILPSSAFFWSQEAGVNGTLFTQFRKEKMFIFLATDAWNLFVGQRLAFLKKAFDMGLQYKSGLQTGFYIHITEDNFHNFVGRRRPV